MTATAVCALAFGLAACAVGMSEEDRARQDDPAARSVGRTDAGHRTAYPVTAEGAAAFVADAETRLAALSEEAARIQWTRATNITYDTMWLESRINAEVTELQVQLANEAARLQRRRGPRRRPPQAEPAASRHRPARPQSPGRGQSNWPTSPPVWTRPIRSASSSSRAARSPWTTPMS
jgi:hypothetical protein